jgi:tRNA(fMet)-specific endonuclease VapC
MIYLLDTNTCIIYLKGKNIHLKEKLDSISTSEIAVCSIVKSELFYIYAVVKHPTTDF